MAIKTDLRKLPIGTVLASNIYASSGQLLLTKGAFLQPVHIQRLIDLGINEVYISKGWQGREHGLEFAFTPLNPPPSVPASKRLQEVFRQTQTVMQDLMQRITVSRPVAVSEFEGVVNIIYPEVVATQHIFAQLDHLRGKDEYTLQHSISVAIMSLKIAQLLGYPERNVRNIGMAGLLHDIGKCHVPAQILNKSGPLNPAEFKEMNKHPLYGYRILHGLYLGDHSIKVAVLQHHERVDGGGYPFHSTGERIHAYSRIVAVADAFDAMTSDRVYRPRMSLFQAAQEIMEGSFGHLDAVICWRFLDYIMNLSPGERVRLNNGEIAEIIMMDRAEPCRPLVRVGERFIDLKVHRHLSVEEIVTSGKE